MTSTKFLFFKSGLEIKIQSGLISKYMGQNLARHGHTLIIKPRITTEYPLHILPPLKSQPMAMKFTPQ